MLPEVKELITKQLHGVLINSQLFSSGWETVLCMYVIRPVTMAGGLEVLRLSKTLVVVLETWFSTGEP